MSVTTAADPDRDLDRDRAAGAGDRPPRPRPVRLGLLGMLPLAISRAAPPCPDAGPAVPRSTAGLGPLALLAGRPAEALQQRISRHPARSGSGSGEVQVVDVVAEPVLDPDHASTRRHRPHHRRDETAPLAAALQDHHSVVDIDVEPVRPMNSSPKMMSSTISRYRSSSTAGTLQQVHPAEDPDQPAHRIDHRQPLDPARSRVPPRSGSPPGRSSLPAGSSAPRQRSLSACRPPAGCSRPIQPDTRPAGLCCLNSRSARKRPRAHGGDHRPPAPRSPPGSQQRPALYGGPRGQTTSRHDVLNGAAHPNLPSGAAASRTCPSACRGAGPLRRVPAGMFTGTLPLLP